MPRTRRCGGQGTGRGRLFSFQNVSGKEIKDIIKDGGKDNVKKLKIRLANMKNRTNRILLESIFAFFQGGRGQVITLPAGIREYGFLSHGNRKKACAWGREDINNLQYAAMLMIWVDRHPGQDPA